MLAHSLLLPIFDYDVCYLNVSEEVLNKLQRFQNLVIRRACINSTSPNFELSLICCQSDFAEIRTFFHSFLRPLTTRISLIIFVPVLPIYMLKEVQCYTDTTHRRPTQNSLQKYSSLYAAFVWNQLPKTIQKSPSINLFTSQLKQLLATLDT